MSIKTKYFLSLSILSIVLLNVSIVSATDKITTTFTYRSAESEQDTRYNYDTALLELALKNTVDSDGPYELVPSPVMNFSRAHYFVKQNYLPNFFIKLTYEESLEEKNMAYVPFPIDLGIVGFRVCFVSPDVKEELLNVTTLDELKQFSHGQGKGWADTQILRHNGFEVEEVGKYENLFAMVARGRFDLFCRGTNELLGEVENHQHIKNLMHDESMVISYPIPRFFYTNKMNYEALDRVRRGVMIAYENGTLKDLWEAQYQKSIDYVNLKNRKMFELENPLVDTLNFDYKKYFFDPLQ